MLASAIFWIVLFVILVVAEFATVQFVTIWFAAGALVAVFLSGFPFWIQLIAFVAVSLVLLILTRPLVKKLTKKPYVPTNADLDIGASAKVIETIDNESLKGRVSLKGVDWSARSTDGAVIQEGQTVIVDRIEGSKLFVSVKK